jgi:hypothetical protein
MEKNAPRCRKLRLLILNDEEVVPITIPVDRVPCAHPYVDQDQDRLGSWAQHLWLWMNGEIPDFDLLLIDIRFDKDLTDPKYPDERANPLGLLHALALVGQVRAARMPFVWGIHSSAKESVLDDPVALVCYGLLRAMDHANVPDPGLEDEFVRLNPDLPQYFRDNLDKGRDVTNLPDSTVRAIVRKYRAAFVLACGDYLSVQPHHIDPLVELANNYIATGEKALVDELQSSFIVVSNGVGTEGLYLQSFFADVGDWTTESVRTTVLPDLRSLSEVARMDWVYDDVMRCLRHLDEDQLKISETPLTAADVIRTELKGRDHNGRHRRVGMGLVFCRCLELLHEQRTRPRQGGSSPFFSSEDVGGRLGYVGNSGQAWVNRLVNHFFGKNFPAAAFIDQLVMASIPLAWLQNIGRKFWDKLNERHLAKDSYHKSLPRPLCLYDASELGEAS